MAHEAPQTPCCLTASDDALDEDPDVFAGCETCPVAAQIDGLDTPNREAFQLYRQVVCRFTVDSQTVGMVFERLTGELGRDDFVELLTRFGILYDALSPPRDEPGESE